MDNNFHLSSQLSQLNAIFDNMTEGIIVADNKGNMISANPVALRMVGLTSLAEYRHVSDFKRNFEIRSLDGGLLEPEEWAIGKALQGEVFTNYEMIVSRKDIDLKWIGSFGGTPIYDNDGIMIMAIISIRDVTEQKRQQEKLIQIEKQKNEELVKTIEMKDEFISLISHEFKTPLTVINSAIQAMEFLCGEELSDKAKGYVDKIRQNSNRQLKLVNNLLDITRMHAGRLAVKQTDLDIVSLSRNITDSIKFYTEGKGIKLSFTSTLLKKVIAIDEEKYERVLLNLLSNAIKYTPCGKSIKVRLSQKIIDTKSKVCIQVIDKGVGIPDDKKEFIFERFGQVDSSLSRQAEGTGIGLYLARQMVDLMGGNITLESRVGKGSTFTILLPAAKSKDTPIEQLIKQAERNNDRLIQETAIEFSDIYI